MNPYRQIFIDFSRAELASGGPDPQVALWGRTVGAKTHLHEAERALQCGLFVAPYTVGAGTVLTYLSEARYPFEHWPAYLIQHKDGFPMRRERRAVWGDDRVKLMKSIDSFAAWCGSELPGLRSASYDELYASVNKHCAYFGRYAAMKVLETLWHAGLIENSQSSIVARGAKYPRKMLGLMFPEHSERLNSKDNSIETIDLSNELAAEAAQWIGRQVSWFQLETLLCNARQSLAGKYAGRSHDRELAHWRKANGHFRDHGVDLRLVFPFYRQRRTLFQAEYLGELGDPPWWGSREDLEIEQKRRIKDALAAE